MKNHEYDDLWWEPRSISKIDPESSDAYKLIELMYTSEGYGEGNKKTIKAFSNRYLSNHLLSKYDANILWLVKNGHIKIAMGIAKKAYNKDFVNIISENFHIFSKECFDDLLSNLTTESKIYILCTLYKDNNQHWKTLYKKQEFSKEIENLLESDVSVFENPILKKRPHLGGSLFTLLAEVFFRMNPSRRMFASWVGKNVKFTSQYEKNNLKVGCSGDIENLDKWIESNAPFKVKIPKISRTNELLLETVNSLINGGNKHKKSSSISGSLEDVFNMMLDNVDEGIMSKDIFEENLFRLSTIRKSMTNSIARENKDLCDNYLAFKKL
jgi:hypothetical protein